MRESERERGRKERNRNIQKRRNERQKIGMKKSEEQMEEKTTPHVSLGMSDRASSGKWELVLKKQTKIY